MKSMTMNIVYFICFARKFIWKKICRDWGGGKF